MYCKTVILIAMLLCCCANYSWAIDKAPTNLAVPNDNSLVDFSLKDLDNKTHSLLGHKGKIIFLNFWATWCPPCRSEMPSMQKLYDNWDKKKYVMLAVNIGESRDAVKSFADKNHYTFPILLDSDQTVARKYRVQGIPTTFIIDAKGKIIDKIVGSREWSLVDFK